MIISLTSRDTSMVMWYAITWYHVLFYRIRAWLKVLSFVILHFWTINVTLNHCFAPYTHPKTVFFKHVNLAELSNRWFKSTFWLALRLVTLRLAPSSPRVLQNSINVWSGIQRPLGIGPKLKIFWSWSGLKLEKFSWLVLEANESFPSVANWWFFS